MQPQDTMKLPGRLRAHSVQLDNRERAIITGVEDVDNFNEHEINLVTAAGYLTLTGSDLHISRLSLDEGQLVVEGVISGISYSAMEERSGGLFSRLFS